MKAGKELKRRIETETLTLGTLATFQLSVSLVDISINAGLDYLIVDLEHFSHSHQTVADVCTVGRLANFPVLIRPPSVETETLHVIMDLGPCGLLIPYVQSTETLDQVRKSIYLQPRGDRRPGGFSIRGLSNLHYEAWKTEVEDDFIVLPQIENRVGLANVESIAAHPLTTAIAIGPYDLAADLGVLYHPEQPIHIDAVRRIRQAGRKAGKNMWHIGDGAALVAGGFSFICIAEPTMAMETALKKLAQAARQGSAAAPVTTPPLP
jgi:2-keto-3-deoxy-L-rhamnonate aldolase RhmA